MGSRPRTTFEKRRKELARKEKQRLKAERRAQRKLAGGQAGGPPIEEMQPPSGSETETDPRTR